MNENIKEIIKMSADEDIEIEYINEKGSYTYKNIDIYELLDYITDLQEENEHLDKVNCQLRKKINNDIYKSKYEELEKYIIERAYLDDDNTYLDKIKELKGE